MTTVLPNGSAFSCASFPLPKDHWSTAPGYNTPPMRLRMGIDDPKREAWDKIVREAA